MALAESTVESQALSQRPLSLIFYDLNDPLDAGLWAGTAAHIIHHLREAGHKVSVVGPQLPTLRRVSTSLFYHFYNRVFRKYYHVDRDRFLTWVFTQVGNLKLFLHARADGVITLSPPFTAYLRSREPIYLLHDGTWSQMLETYPHLSPSRMPSRIVEGGKKLDNITFRRSDVSYVMASKWAADRATSDYGIDPKKMSVLPFGANFDVDPSDSEVAAGISARGRNVCQLLFVGRDWERKGGPLAVAICCALRGLGVEVELHVVGCSPTGLTDFVHVHGLLRKTDPAQRELLQRLYTESDFFLLPASAEAQGIVFNESAAYGLPVIATNVGGISSVVQHDVWGVLFLPDTPPEAYAQRIASIYKDRELYLNMCWSARRDYVSRLSGSRYVAQLVNIIRRHQANRS
ncbi:glycosyltransferase [Terriglobus roseus DSM 18391]|uniref:Glycosyltransferase n=1 Tax=Terriglobus roseus (strain DSM 18391 / NRRL B-41598 / KBS 63) TaxID=926566 RepID=I3ZFL5_TERRK|nr:glycosyltransferase family 4 protein [Terriglobus roseus]AFL88033.1 glycosyltransferase [Terriglobus roseus DSM 18391]